MFTPFEITLLALFGGLGFCIVVFSLIQIIQSFCKNKNLDLIEPRVNAIEQYVYPKGLGSPVSTRLVIPGTPEYEQNTIEKRPKL